MIGRTIKGKYLNLSNGMTPEILSKHELFLVDNQSVDVYNWGRYLVSLLDYISVEQEGLSDHLL